MDVPEGWCSCGGGGGSGAVRIATRVLQKHHMSSSCRGGREAGAIGLEAHQGWQRLGKGGNRSPGSFLAKV